MIFWSFTSFIFYIWEICLFLCNYCWNRCYFLSYSTFFWFCNISICLVLESDSRAMLCFRLWLLYLWWWLSLWFWEWFELSILAFLLKSLDVWPMNGFDDLSFSCLDGFLGPVIWCGFFPSLSIPKNSKMCLPPMSNKEIISSWTKCISFYLNCSCETIPWHTCLSICFMR